MIRILLGITIMVVFAFPAKAQVDIKVKNQVLKNICLNLKII